MAALGTTKNPLILRVQTAERAQQIAEICEERGWKMVIGIEPAKAEDLTDFEQKLNPPTVRLEQSIGRNESCPCGSGRKFKKCCLIDGPNP
jgi:SWIM/SEC-C metal-binding protein